MVLVYFLLGLIVFFVAQRLDAWSKARGGHLACYHWLGFAVVALWTLFVAAWIGTSLAEGYPKPAGIGGLIWGGLDLVLIILLRFWLVSAVGRKSAAASAGTSA